MTGQTFNRVMTILGNERPEDRALRAHASDLPGIQRLCDDLIPALIEDHRAHDLHPIRHFSHEGISIRASLLYEVEGAREAYQCHLALNDPESGSLSIKAHTRLRDDIPYGTALLKVTAGDTHPIAASHLLERFSEVLDRYADRYRASRISDHDQLADGEEAVRVSKWKPLVIDDELKPALA